MTFITWACLRCVQELATILGPQNPTQRSCVRDTVKCKHSQNRALRRQDPQLQCTVVFKPITPVRSSDIVWCTQCTIVLSTPPSYKAHLTNWSRALNGQRSLMVTTDHTQCLALTHCHFINNSVILDTWEGIELNQNFNVDVWIL